MFIDPEIKTTADGSQTLIHPVYGDSYHSLNGAVAESMHVFIQNGLKACGKKQVSILEAGFGSGLNALLTLREVVRSGLPVNYTAVELYPVGEDTLRDMEYSGDSCFMDLHTAEWGRIVEIIPGFLLHKINGDLADTGFDSIFDIVYFDAFSPETQPGLWSVEVFSRIFHSMSPGGILVTYSAKGTVKQALREAGFDVYRLPGGPGKRHMVRAVKPQ